MNSESSTQKAAPSTPGSANVDHSPEAIAAQMLEFFGTIMRSGQAPLVQAAEQYDLTFSQLKILFILSTCDRPQAVNELAEATTLSLPAAGRAVDAVVRSGLVTRTEDADDRRVKRIALTEHGQRIADEINETRAALVRGLVLKLHDGERRALAEALGPLIAALPERMKSD
ncbi:MAG: MarR family winged helix-turn-helix transcriptional regulator [Solirubrobacterales bacterium]